MPSPALHMPIAPGTMLGKYQVVRLLAVGGMAEIYLARTTGLAGFEKAVVLKRIQPVLAQNSELVEMFLDEARLTASLSHPNVVAVHDVDRIGDSVFFTMEYVNGCDLAEVLREAAKKKRGLSLAHAIYVVSNVAAGLHYAHDKKGKDGQPLGTVHRDVTRNNVMITHDGLVKIVDFGIAKAAVRRGKTKTGTVKGTAEYMSPEQAQGLEIDRRSDVWSLGVLLYELTTGTRPFRAKTDLATVYKLVNEDVPPPSTRREGYSPELERIVMKALRRSPDDRYATAGELHDELEAFARDQKLVATAATLAKFMREIFDKKMDSAELFALPRLPDAPAELPRVATSTRITATTNAHAAIAQRRTRIWPWVLAAAAGATVFAGWALLRNNGAPTATAPASAAPPIQAPSASEPALEPVRAPTAPTASTIPAPNPKAAHNAKVAPAPSANETTKTKQPKNWNLDSPLPP